MWPFKRQKQESEWARIVYDPTLPLKNQIEELKTEVRGLAENVNSLRLLLLGDRVTAGCCTGDICEPVLGLYTDPPFATSDGEKPENTPRAPNE